MPKGGTGEENTRVNVEGVRFSFSLSHSLSSVITNEFQRWKGRLKSLLSDESSWSELERELDPSLLRSTGAELSSGMVPSVIWPFRSATRLWQDIWRMGDTRNQDTTSADYFGVRNGQKQKNAIEETRYQNHAKIIRHAYSKFNRSVPRSRLRGHMLNSKDSNQLT